METTKTDIESIANAHSNLQKIFRAKSVWWVTMLGGPLGAGYIMAHNYKVFEEPAKAKRALIAGVVLTILLLLLSINLSHTIKIPSQLIPFIYTGIAYGLIHYYQGKNIELYEKNGGTFFSGWREGLVIIIASSITLVCFFSISYFINPDQDASIKEYGTQKNTILYHSSNITVPEVDKIATVMTNFNYFNDKRQIKIYVEKSYGNYEITIPVKAESWNNRDIIKAFNEVRDTMQFYFPDNPIVLKLSSGGFKNVKKILRSAHI